MPCISEFFPRLKTGPTEDSRLVTSNKNRWLLPDGVDELLPEQAQLLEQCRRQVLDTFAANGYKLVQPPLLEFIDSLLTGAGNDLDLLTFKVTDQYSGRMMGVRADMTPQLSRIDAHVLNQESVNRLCYLGSVLQTADRSGFHSREPIQFGAELFGYAGEQADVEIIRLCTDVLNSLGLSNLYVDLGHVGIFRELIQQAGFNPQQVTEMVDICLRKSWPDMSDFITQHQLDDETAKIFKGLLSLEGEVNQTFDAAQALMENCGPEVRRQLQEFNSLVRLLMDYLPSLTVSIDFLELRGINYHTGAVFSVYCDQYAHAIAKGGRYDDVGQAFGRARPATGFSADLKQCLNFSKLDIESDKLIRAPFSSDPALREFIQALREQGEKVIIGFEQEQLSDTYERRIINQNGEWKVIDE